MTSIWEGMLRRKTFYDVTGNGVTHPNDFGHMVYAQGILALLFLVHGWPPPPAEDKTA